MRVLFCGGGTGGHVYPAVAMVEALKRKYGDAEIAFAVRRGGGENEVIREKDYPMYEMDVAGLKREVSVSNLKTVWKLLLSLKRAGDILDNFHPDLVIGTGGYVCFPVIWKAQIRHIPTILHESNAIPGLSVKLLSKKADRVFLNFDESQKYFSRQDNLVVTGTPVREEFCQLTKEEARKICHIKKDDFLIVSFGGSLGSEKMNDCIIPLLLSEKAGNKIKHIHAVGTRYYEKIKSKWPSLCQKNARVKIVPFIKDVPTWMKAADLLIARSGASTVSEAATAKCPVILIPSPNVTGNHQYYNAERLAKCGAAILIEEKDLSTHLLKQKTEEIMNQESLRNSLSKNISRFSMENAETKILPEIEKLFS